MQLFEVRVFSQSGSLLRKSLIQAVNKDHAMPEVYNVFHNTPEAFRFEVE